MAANPVGGAEDSEEKEMVWTSDGWRGLISLFLFSRPRSQRPGSRARSFEGASVGGFNCPCSPVGRDRELGDEGARASKEDNWLRGLIVRSEPETAIGGDHHCIRSIYSDLRSFEQRPSYVALRLALMSTLR